jgi:hypothetical protein
VCVQDDGFGYERAASCLRLLRGQYRCEQEGDTESDKSHHEFLEARELLRSPGQTIAIESMLIA